jgi:hypothetical protein
MGGCSISEDEPTRMIAVVVVARQKDVSFGRRIAQNVPTWQFSNSPTTESIALTSLTMLLAVYGCMWYYRVVQVRYELLQEAA